MIKTHHLAGEDPLIFWEVLEAGARYFFWLRVVVGKGMNTRDHASVRRLRTLGNLMLRQGIIGSYEIP